MRLFSVKHILLLFIAVCFLGFTGKEKYLELDGAMNARSSARFTQSSGNYLFVLGKNTKAEILKHKKFHSGNYGLQVRVASGPHKNKVVWVYYNVSRPTMALFEKCPDTWATAGVNSCKPGSKVERANASVTTAPVPATRYTPIEIPAVPVSLETAKPSSDTQGSVGTCIHCSKPNPVATYVDELVAATSKDALTGAYRVMANLYQSCHVLNLRPFNPSTDNQMSRYINIRRSRGHKVRSIPSSNLDEVARTHYYLRDLPETKNPMCRDMREAPPIYHYGGRPSFENGNVIDIFDARRTGGAPMTGIDCSAFVSTALSVAGLKLTPNVRNASQNMTTSRDLRAMTAANSCFNRPSFSAGQTIMPGDVVAWRGHTFMIDRVGQDPFGIEKAISRGTFPRSASACSRFQPPLSDLDFTLIQSTGTGNLPAVRIEAKDYRSTTAVRGYLNMAVQACKAQFQTAPSSSTVAGMSSTVTTLLRHKGESDPRCSFKKEETPKLKGEECTQGCLRGVNT